ncbi:MAG TPA: amidohydrolase family protein [Xanthobacteraceae bacterium]|jgi:aminocarboxymuconate-semialdehyde decarboxylase|nr:amidohydrolase family protein [Xanthobacteraceae bacterium]
MATRIDAFNHFFPKKYFDTMLEIVGTGKDMGRRVLEVPCLHDIDVRRKVIDQFPDYAQIISLAAPAIEALVTPEKAEELARIANDGMAELVAKYPDHFVGFVAQTPLTAPDAGVAETERAIKQLGAAGAQIYTNVNGKPLDRPEFEPFFAAMNRINKPIWIHPLRGANISDYPDEDRSLYEIWWTFGWPYETSVAMARLVFSRMLDKYPNLKLIAHHLGAMVPYFEGRVGPGWDQLGARTTDVDYVALRKSLKKRPLDYFKQDFYADSATFGSRAATVCGLEFYGADRVVFASDCPFDPEKGPGYIRETLQIIDSLDLSKADRDKIYFGNIEQMTGMKFRR